MERLCDHRSDDETVLGAAARLARAVEIEEPRFGLQQRIASALAETRRVQTGARHFYLRPAFALIALLSLGAVAAAMTGAAKVWPRLKAAISQRAPHSSPRRVSSVSKSVPTETVIVPSPVVPPPPAIKRPVMAAPPERALIALDPAAALVAPVPATKTTLVDDPAFVETATPRRTTSPTPTPTTTTSGGAVSAPVVALKQEKPEAVQKRLAAAPEEAIMVVQATRALHEEHDPKRAAHLLENYLQRFPDGDLVEESLALLIEAKSERDDASAAKVASEYLERFPFGRFRQVAERAKERFSK